VRGLVRHLLALHDEEHHERGDHEDAEDGDEHGSPSPLSPPEGTSEIGGMVRRT
jgi:hypothetical protein